MTNHPRVRWPRALLPVRRPLLLTLIALWGLVGEAALAMNLAGLAELARQRTLSLKMARLDLEESWIDQRIADNTFIPNAELEYRQGQRWLLDQDQKRLSGSFQGTSLFSLRLSQEFRALGKYNEWQRDVSRLKTQVRELLLERAELDVMRRLVRLFFQLVKHEELARIHRFNLGLIAQLLDIGRLNQQVGLALQKDVLRIEVQQANTQAALVRAEHDFANTRFDLANLLNLRDTASPAIELPPSLKYPLAQIDATATRALLMERDLDLGLARLDRAIVAKTLTAGRSAKKPALNLTGTYNYAPRNGPFAYTRDFTVGFSLVGTLYDGGDKMNEVRRYEKLLAKADLALQDLEASKLLTLEKAFSDYDEARQRIAFAEKALDQSRENMRVVGIRFKAGDAPITDLVDAQITFSGAAETAVNAYYDERVRLAEILLLTRQFDRVLQLDRGAARAIEQAIDLTGEEAGISPDMPAMNGSAPEAYRGVAAEPSSEPAPLAPPNGPRPASSPGARAEGEPPSDRPSPASATTTSAALPSAPTGAAADPARPAATIAPALPPPGAADRPTDRQATPGSEATMPLTPLPVPVPGPYETPATGKETTP
ncbi:MAG: Outer membrane protein [Candidatus Ozemobacter sibiricus]|jgi:outer membrane protein TolC|uniref:Outer membrane protein n=1 Tax=Candidatus Ozemobacter sibiricus TaxID=2268124 RepID=A0A367ZLV4_9BACT|nr:MAG: Outer membrane protein [Candidatus Ozemobacter sibiricus]